MRFAVVDKDTGREVSADVVDKIAKNGKLMDMDIDQFAIGEDGTLYLLDECGNYTICSQGWFDIQLEDEEEEEE